LLLLDVQNAAAYLAARGYPLCGAVTPLGGGVSNTVLLAETTRGRLVIKQALERLRVAEEWLSDPARTLREAAALQDVAALLPPGAVPAVAFLDEANYIYAMDAAPPGAQDWKTLLLAGQIDPAIGAHAGRLLAQQIAATRALSPWRDRYGDQRVFDELRLDPYYRFTAARHPDLAPHFAQAIARCQAQATSLVHGDWSPKNMLIAAGRPMLIDYEVVHYGDPAFDAAFLLNHLLLKSHHRPQWRSRYAEAATAFWHAAAPAVSAGGVKLHLGCLLLARLDGKSPAEYLDEDTKPILRALARDILNGPPDNLLDLWTR
jgi:5-methylthioribose kinase